MRTRAIVRTILVALVLGALALAHSACGGSGYESPTSPATVGTPSPGATPTPRGY
jgi:hypothetical protein